MEPPKTLSPLSQLLLDNENWLIRRILYYAKLHQFTQYTSTLEEAWRISISGLTHSLIEGIKRNHAIPDFGPDESFRDDPLTDFGVIEAQRHRKRGITLSMFLGLMKYYRQAYVDLVEELDTIANQKKNRLLIERSFDRIEIAFCQEWAQTSQEVRLNELQNTNRIMTNEKNAYLTVFESLIDPAILVDGTLNIINLNHAAAQLIEPDRIPGSDYYQDSFDSEQWGKISSLEKRQPCIGQNLDTLFPWLTIFFDSYRNWQSFHSDQFEHQVVIHGNERIFNISWSNLLDISDRFTSIIITMRDITEQKAAEIEIRTRETTLQSILRAVPVGIGLVINRVLMQVNDRMCELCGYEREELLGQSSRILYPTQDEFDWVGREKYQQIKETGTGTVETRWQRKDGQIVDVLLSSTPLDPSDLLQGVTFSVLDITDRKRALKELQNTMDALSAKNQELDQFAYSVSHDLKNPLITIKGMFNWIKQSIAEKKLDTLEEDFKFIDDACRKMERLLDSLLQLSRLGRTLGEPEAVMMADIVHNALESCRGSLTQRGVQVMIKDPLGQVLCDPLRMRQVWENLISNAIKFMGDQPEPMIEIGCCENKNNIYYIHDNGLGIESRHFDIIFDSFSRLNNHVGGSGLGLAMVKRIVQAHRGKIWVESAGIGQGSTFYFYLDSQLA